MPPGPGKLWGLYFGQRPGYRETTRYTRELVYYLSTYLGQPPPSTGPETNVAKVFFCPGFERYKPPVQEPMAERTCYGVYAPKYSALTNLTFKPFGYPPGESDPMERPHKISEIQALTPLADTWMVVDLDQVGSPTVGWKDEIPPTPVHGSTRTYLFFDNHVGVKKAGKRGTY